MQALVFLQWLEASSGMQYDYAMHADDDSFIRLDLLLPLMVGRAVRCMHARAEACSVNCKGCVCACVCWGREWSGACACAGWRLHAVMHACIHAQIPVPTYPMQRWCGACLRSRTACGGMHFDHVYSTGQHVPHMSVACMDSRAGGVAAGALVLGLHLGRHGQPCDAAHPEPQLQVPHACQPGAAEPGHATPCHTTD